MTLPWLPPSHSAEGHLIDETLLLVHLLIAVVFIGWAIYYIIVLITGRSRRSGVSEGANSTKSRTSIPIQLPWILVGLVALAEISLFIGRELPTWDKLRVVPPESADVVHVRVVAEQFAWNVRYPGADGVFGRTAIDLVTQMNPIGLDTLDRASRDDVLAINQMHLPVGRPAIIELSSKDVIHAFFLPVMRVKQDVIPGQRSRVWFTPTVEDTTDIACAQLCGLGHYRMKGQLIVESEAAWLAWLGEKR